MTASQNPLDAGPYQIAAMNDPYSGKEPGGAANSATLMPTNALARTMMPIVFV